MEDIEEIANDILGKLVAPESPYFKVTPEQADMMKRYDWPGNIR
jgi:DNA-binding NtrC family response regulator